MRKTIKHVGTSVRITGQFYRPVTNVAVDPIELEIHVRAPDATTTIWVYGTDVEVVRDSAGNYHLDYLLEQEGTYHWKWYVVAGPLDTVVVAGDLDSVSDTDF